MQYRLRTLGIVVACIAIVLAIGKQVGIVPLLVFAYCASYIAPVVVSNAWWRAGVSFLVAGLSGAALAAINPLAREYDIPIPWEKRWPDVLMGGIWGGLYAATVCAILSWGIRLEDKPKPSRDTPQD